MMTFSEEHCDACGGLGTTEVTNKGLAIGTTSTGHEEELTWKSSKLAEGAHLLGTCTLNT